MKIMLIGAGYVGLVSALGFCEMGHQIVLVEREAEKLARLKAGITTMHERGVVKLLQKHLSGRLCLTNSIAAHTAAADVGMICVGPPSSKGGAADPVAVFDVVRELLPILGGATVLVSKSTVPVGTCARIRAVLRERGVACCVA